VRWYRSSDSIAASVTNHEGVMVDWLQEAFEKTLRSPLIPSASPSARYRS
jgi:hypothetical protein